MFFKSQDHHLNYLPPKFPPIIFGRSPKLFIPPNFFSLTVLWFLWNCIEICRSHLNKLNIQLQGKTLFYEATSKLNAFKIKIQLYREQFENHDYTSINLQAQIVKLILTSKFLHLHIRQITFWISYKAWCGWILWFLSNVFTIYFWALYISYSKFKFTISIIFEIKNKLIESQAETTIKC